MQSLFGKTWLKWTKPLLKVPPVMRGQAKQKHADERIHKPFTGVIIRAFNINRGSLSCFPLSEMYFLFVLLFNQFHFSIAVKICQQYV